MRYTLAEIPSGEAGTDRTVERLTELVNDALRRPRIRLQSIRILERAGVPNRDQAAAARALWRWVHTKIRYVPDPIDLETVQDPEVTLQIGAGDCDDHTALLSALAQAIGIPVRLRVVGRHRDRFEHIFAELFVKGQWWPADTTHARAFGQRAPRFEAEKVYDRKGAGTMLGAVSMRTVGLTQDQVAWLSYQAAADTLRRNWQNGLINRDDVAGYLRVIQEGNFPAPRTSMERGTRKAIENFLHYVDRFGLKSSKPAGQLNGLEGLQGFISTLWNAGKKLVGKAVNFVTGKSDVQVDIPPINVTLPDNLIQTNVPRGAFAEGAAGIMSSPAVWIGIGLLGVAVLGGFFRGRG